MTNYFSKYVIKMLKCNAKLNEHVIKYKVFCQLRLTTVEHLFTMYLKNINNNFLLQRDSGKTYKYERKRSYFSKENK